MFLSDDAVARIEEQIKTLFAGQMRIEKRQDNFEKEIKDSICDLYREMKALKEQFANRLPTWATIVISILTALLGGCVGRLIGG